MPLVLNTGPGNWNSRNIAVSQTTAFPFVNDEDFFEVQQTERSQFRYMKKMQIEGKEFKAQIHVKQAVFLNLYYEWFVLQSGKKYVSARLRV